MSIFSTHSGDTEQVKAFFPVCYTSPDIEGYPWSPHIIPKHIKSGAQKGDNDWVGVSALPVSSGHL